MSLSQSESRLSVGLAHPELVTTRSRHGLPSAVWFYLPVGTLGLLLAWWIASPESYGETIGTKEGPIEWVTVAFLFVAIAAGLDALRRRTLLPGSGVRTWILMVTAGAIYFCGEELSWGQHIFHWSTPEVFAAVNRQQETGLHNISGWFNEKPRGFVEMWALAGGVGGGLVSWLRRDPRGRELARMAAVVLAALHAAADRADRRPHAHPRPARQVPRRRRVCHRVGAHLPLPTERAAGDVLRAALPALPALDLAAPAEEGSAASHWPGRIGLRRRA